MELSVQRWHTGPLLDMWIPDCVALTPTMHFPFKAEIFISNSHFRPNNRLWQVMSILDLEGIIILMRPMEFYRNNVRWLIAQTLSMLVSYSRHSIFIMMSTYVAKALIYCTVTLCSFLDLSLYRGLFLRYSQDISHYQWHSSTMSRQWCMEWVDRSCWLTG